MKVLADLDTERALLGCMLVPGIEAVRRAIELVAVEDFYSPKHQAIFDACCTLHLSGRAVDARTVMALLTQRQNTLVKDEAELSILTARIGSLAALETYATTVADLAMRRRLVVYADDIRTLAHEPESDVLDEARSRLGNIHTPLSGPTDDLYDDAEDFLALPRDRSPWLIPGLLRRSWRVVVVAPEGLIKSVLLREIATAAAFGVHPFTLRPMEPVRSLIVDLENPQDVVQDSLEPILRRAGKTDRGRPPAVWQRQAGLNLRTRVGRRDFEANVAHVRPDLVCLGPIYKSYAVTARETDEQAAGEVQVFLDDMRARYGFAMVLEHHAPHGTGGKRALRPIGSSLWLRWPEMGLSIAPDDDEADAPHPRILIISRYRRDRVRNAWPSELHRGDGWPWVGKWSDGMPDEEPEVMF